jgi:hypothetical protein
MCEKKTYTLVLRSANKSSGTNSNANYLINWETILPKQYQVFNLKVTMMTELFTLGTDPASVETRINLGKVSLWDTNNLDNLVHHSRLTTVYTDGTDTYTWYESLNNNFNYTIQRPNNNIITIKNYSFEETADNPTTSTIFTSDNNGELKYIMYLEFTPKE